jgi:two-component system, NtrC family, response regulator HydG
MAEMLADGLAERGYDAVAESSSSAAALKLEGEDIDALVTDLRMPNVDGLALLAISQRTAPDRPVIVMTAYSAVDTAVESIRQGARHYLTKPFKLDELALFLDRALEERRVRRETRELRKALGERFSLSNVLGKSRAMLDVFDIVERVAATPTPVLLTGETGSGKGVLARAIHAESGRARRPFVQINCAALPESLLESELFGHVKGAFTGAAAHRPGLFAEADGGTLLLDEIGEMALPLQSKILHVLESGVVRAVGASREQPVDVRIVAATHRDLRERVRAGQFREDLLYRLEVVTIELPPLRHRREDIPLFVERFLAEQRARHPHSKVERISAEAMQKLLDHAWPGNVRELSHVIERVVLLARGEEVAAAELPATITAAKAPHLPASFEGGVLPVREVQRRYAAWALEALGGHRTRTAEALGVDLKTLAKWLSEE